MLDTATTLWEIETIKQLKARCCRYLDTKRWEQVHAPEITLTSATTATGVWALEDVVRLGPGINLNGRGHCHETYAKLDGRWRIKTSTLTRLREDVFNPLYSVRISPRWRDAVVILVRRFGR
jgi:hypothetical protein